MRQDVGRQGCRGREGGVGLEKEDDAKTERRSLLGGCSRGDVHVSLIVS